MNTPFDTVFSDKLKALEFSEDEFVSLEKLERRIKELQDSGKILTKDMKEWIAFYEAYEKELNSHDLDSSDTGAGHEFLALRPKSELVLRLEGEKKAFESEYATDLNQKLQDKLNALKLSSSPRPRFFVAGSPETEICIMANQTLAMRIRFGNLFSGGGAAIELFMESLSTFLKPVDVAIIGMEVFEPFLRKKNAVKLFAQCTAENKLDYFEHLGILAEKAGIKFEVNKEKNQLTSENEKPEATINNITFHPSPLSKTLTL